MNANGRWNHIIDIDNGTGEINVTVRLHGRQGFAREKFKLGNGDNGRWGRG